MVILIKLFWIFKMETTIHWIEKDKQREYFPISLSSHIWLLGTFPISWLRPVEEPPPPYFVSSEVFSVVPYDRRIEHDPTYQEIQPQNRPLTSLVENQGFQFFSRKSTESASLHNIREKRQKRYSCKTISYPSLGLVCIQHTRDYRFNWDAVKIWRLLQKWKRPKVTIIS